MTQQIPVFTTEQVVRLWLERQGLLDCDQPRSLTQENFTEHLEATGGLQVDSVNVVDRAHYLTLWSRFGAFDRAEVDGWVYDSKLAYEYWGHEASILPISHLPIGKRRMLGFPPDSWRKAAYWSRYDSPEESKRRVMKLIRQHGPLESGDFEASESDRGERNILGWGSVIPKEDKRSLNILWHAGKLAICGRTHFRKRFELAQKFYPQVPPATAKQFQDSWLLLGLSGNGIATAKHLSNYITGPNPTAEERRESIERNLKSRKVVEVRVAGSTERWFALPELLDRAIELKEPTGTTLLCPFDSLLWQRGRAEQLLNFHYRIEIYVPESKRKFGYYVMPILHNGRLVGRLDPKLHREKQRLEIKSLHLEPHFKPSRAFKRLLNDKLEGLAQFLSARALQLPGK